MKCLNKTTLIDYINNELSARKIKQVSAHLSNCDTCRAELVKWQKVLQTTEEFVSQDIAAHPTPPHAHIIQRFEKLPQKKKLFRSVGEQWFKVWTKPVIVTACAIAITVMIYIFSPRTTPIVPNDYYVIDNGVNTEAVTLNEDAFEQLESYYLQEIYENDELRNDILYGDWQNYDDQLQNLEDDEVENLLQELYGEKIT